MNAPHEQAQKPLLLQPSPTRNNDIEDAKEEVVERPSSPTSTYSQDSVRPSSPSSIYFISTPPSSTAPLLVPAQPATPTAPATSQPTAPASTPAPFPQPHPHPEKKQEIIKKNKEKHEETMQKRGCKNLPERQKGSVEMLIEKRECKAGEGCKSKVGRRMGRVGRVFGGLFEGLCLQLGCSSSSKKDDDYDDDNEAEADTGMANRYQEKNIVGEDSEWISGRANTSVNEMGAVTELTPRTSLLGRLRGTSLAKNGDDARIAANNRFVEKKGQRSERIR